VTHLGEYDAEAREIARAFRLGAFLHAGEPMAALISKVAQALGNSPSSLKDELSRILEDLLASHKRGDWLGVADSLEFEMRDWLRRFGADTDIKS
jgi:hypothetical protein